MKIDLLWKGQVVESVLYRKAAYSSIISSVQVDFSMWPTVSNQIRCYLLYDGSKFIKMATSYQPTTQPRRIALIVESPHKDEFTNIFTPLHPLNGRSGNKFDLKIIERMNAWFSQPPTANTLFEIKIFNPVKYQTSLYHFLSNLIPNNQLKKQLPPAFVIPKYGSIHDNDNSSLRNEVWKILFTNATFPCESDFKHEIKKYDPQYIVNACTGTNKSKQIAWMNITQIYSRPPRKSLSKYSANNLKTIVRRSVFTYFVSSSVVYREDSHPHQWK